MGENILMNLEENKLFYLYIYLFLLSINNHYNHDNLNEHLSI